MAELVIPGESRSIDTWEEACSRIEAYAELRTLLSKRAIDVLAFYDATRLGRTFSLVATVRQLCATAHVALYETTNPPTEILSAWRYDDALIGAIKSVGSQQEVVKLVERRRIGMIARAKRGEFPGRINYGYNYEYDKQGNRHVAIDEERAEAVRYIFQQFLAGNGSRAIETKLAKTTYRTANNGKWFTKSISKIIDRRWIYAGYIEINKLSRKGEEARRDKGLHPPLISEADAMRVDAELIARARNRRIPNTRSALTYVCFCSECGEAMTNHTNYDKSRNKTYKRMRCQRHAPNTLILDTTVYTALHAFISQLEPTGQTTKTRSDTRIDRLERHIKALRTAIQNDTTAIQRADDAYLSNHMTQERYYAALERIETRQKTNTIGLANAESELADTQNALSQIQTIADLRSYGHAMLDSSDAMAVNAWLRRHFKIYCAKGGKIDTIFLL